MRKQWAALVFSIASGVCVSTGQAQDVLVKLPERVAKSIAYQREASSDFLEILGVTGLATLDEVVPIPMQDGVRLSATIIRPNHTRAGQTRFSTILIKTPYSPTFEVPPGMRRDVVSSLIKKGYVLAIVNDRGTRWSEGSYGWLRGAKNDGYDTLSWIAAQSWSNGRVGTFGCSSSAEGQIPLATLNHPAHKAMVAMSAATGVGEIPGYNDQGIWYLGGVPQLFWSWWFQIFGHHSHPIMPPGISQDDRLRLAKAYSPDVSLSIKPNIERHLPSSQILRAAGLPASDFDELMRLSPGDKGWEKYDFLRTGDSTKVPALHMSSWYDLVEIYPTLKMYEYLSSNSPNQYLVVGPTGHCQQGMESQRTFIGEHDVGDARFDYSATITAFFDHFVQNDGRSEFKDPNVRFYVMGTNQWQKADRWPVDSQPYRLYLHSDGHANSIWGDGTLKLTPPQRNGVASTFVSDPSNPVPSKGASCCPQDQSVDQREVESRHDVLVFTSQPFERDLILAGYVRAKLFLRSDVPDTDIMLKLVVVYPDGRALNLSDTAQRVRYRNGIRRIEFMKPGEIYEVNLSQLATAIKLPKGYRLRIEIAGSNFPAYERNLNTGGSNFDEVTPRVATNSIILDASHSSYVEFSIMHSPSAQSSALIQQ